MPTQETLADPRGIVTPDAFDVSTELLGLPLASPRRRFVALMIDLIAIGILTVVTKSFALILGVVAAIFFVRAGFKRTPVKGSVFGRAMRLSVGCFGVFIALITAALWAMFGIDFGDRPGGDDFQAGFEAATANTGVGLISGIASGFELADAENLDEAQDAIRDLVESSAFAELEPDQAEDILAEVIPSDMPWSDEAMDYAVGLLNESDEEDEDSTTTLDEARDEVADLSAARVLSEYAALVEDQNEAEISDPRNVALRERALAIVAGDTLLNLRSTVADLADDVESAERRRRQAQDALEEEQNRGLFNALAELVDELGFGFGWASLYLTILLSWWNGQTIGKKMMGIRVVRLDGEPITWWIGFERAGGYAAGFATGLLGFAQVWWDANRQAIHDRIVGTVVVVDGAEPIVGWEKTL